jgi:ribosomal protein S2
MLLSSVFFSSFATRDAFKGKVGCVGLLDTNALVRNCTLAIPSNDDSIDWVIFINDVFSEYILIKKLRALLR